MIKKILKYLLIIIFWLTVWQISATVMSNELLFPTPIAVIKRFFELLSTADFYKTVGTSVIRITLGIAIAVVLGIVIATVTSAVPLLHDLLLPIMTVIKSTPVASFIILLLLWMGRDVMPAVISTFIVLPVVWTGVESGIHETDRALLEMSRAYGMKGAARVRYIYAPSVKPYFISSLRSSLGMAWKAGIAAEVLALPVISIGKHIFESKLYLETVDLFAWTLAVIVISLVIEQIFVLAVDRIGRKKTGGESV